MTRETGWLEVRSAALTFAVCLWVAGLAGCYKEEQVLDSTGARSTNSEDGGPWMECAGFETTTEIPDRITNSVDLLFVIDNSASMRDAQKSLREQFPHLIEVLTTGDRDGDAVLDFPPAKDLHLGVVTSDMGRAGLEGGGACDGLGDDGIMNPRDSWMNDPPAEVQGCQESYPRFLSYVAGVDDPLQSAHDFACMASVGTAGCGFAQPLEAQLKALWPAVDPMAESGTNRITFLGGTDGASTFGHGDRENDGFLRNDPEAQSLLAIVIVTDKEDCSTLSGDLFTAQGQPLDRCILDLRDKGGSQLYPLERYIGGLRALRPGHEDLVVFAAITGVPPDLADVDQLTRFDYGDLSQREQFYQRILNDERMQYAIDPVSSTARPSCTLDEGSALPPRRIVQVAQQFGENGLVQSICLRDFRPAIDAIIGIMSKRLGAPCLPRPLQRADDGLVDCDVYWELPKAAEAQARTPTRCDQPGWEFLLDPGPDHPKASVSGRTVCKVAQLAASGAPTLAPVPTRMGGRTFFDGWYYDDFSAVIQEECNGGDSKQRVAFTPSAKPPFGVDVKLVCRDGIPKLPIPGSDLATDPRIGDPCGGATGNGAIPSGDAACQVSLDGTSSGGRLMFCHPRTNVCVLKCFKDADCPAEWICDTSAETVASTGGQAICRAPQCDGI